MGHHHPDKSALADLPRMGAERSQLPSHLGRNSAYERKLGAGGRALRHLCLRVARGPLETAAKPD